MYGRLSGFTLIEILLTIAALGIILGTIIVAINPAAQLAEARNGQRRTDVGALWSAVHQYALDHHGELPTSIPSGTLADCTDTALDDEFTICRTNQCSVVLSQLLENDRYLPAIPVDPVLSDNLYSGYNIVLDTDRNGRITVCAPGAEREAVIYLPE